MLILTFIILWFIFGATGFMFWWTAEFDLEWAQVPMIFMAGLVLGPIAWIIGYCIHGKNGPVNLIGNKVLLKKRTK